MAINVGLMGFGRIGRNIFRILNDHPEIKVVAISEVMPVKTIEYLLRWDTVHGPFPEPVEVQGNTLIVHGRRIALVEGKAPGDVDWQALGVDTVIEATTHYRKVSELKRHLDRGAKRVILTATPEDGDPTDIVIMGVNDELLQKKPSIVSCGSVTLNCVAPILKILHEAYGIRHASMTSVHAYTNAQRLADVPSDDFRASRSAAENIIPSPTSAPKLIGRVIPALAGKLNGIAMNVPIPDGSIVDLVLEMERDLKAEEINQLILKTTQSPRYRTIIDYAVDPIVSSDVIGNPHSAIFDSISTRVLGGNLVKVLAWFDNGWGHASRAVEVIERLGA